MRRNVLVGALVASAFMLSSEARSESQDSTVIKLFDAVTFYDGYLLENNPDSLVQDGVLRHSTSLYAVKMTDEQLNQIGANLHVDVFVQACCDNYDRIGNINLAFVPKGSEKYSPDEVQRIEIGRFITPFMDKNVEPSTVPYAYTVDYLSYILRDKSIRDAYDIWVEFELFGVPYAANKQITGCEGRSDVFKGTLSFVSFKPAEAETTDDVLVPIVMKKPEYKGGNLNNYSESGTDTIGKTTKTYYFDVPVDVADGQLVLITSNHGSNSGGEEYKRRWHYVYYDDNLILTYKPGRKSCEPYRKYNTQVNGIYGYSKMLDFQWQSFSNWCPGDVIDNRIMNLGAVKAGRHKVRISVPDAVFANGQGDIPVSMFFQGLKTGTIASITPVTMESKPLAALTITDNEIKVASDAEVLNIDIYDIQGRCMARQFGSNAIKRPSCPAGMYLVNVELDNGIVETHKVMLK